MMRARPGRLPLLMLLSAAAACLLFALGAWRLLAARAGAGMELDQERAALAVRAAGSLSDALGRCRVVATSGAAPLPDDCTGAQEGAPPFHWFLVGDDALDQAPMAASEAAELASVYHQAVETECGPSSTENACAALAQTMADAPAGAQSVVAYHGARVALWLTARASHHNGTYALQARLERIVFEDTVRRHRTRLATVADGETWLRVGRYHLTALGKESTRALVGWTPSPSPDAVRAFLVARNVLEEQERTFTLVSPAENARPGVSHAFVDADVGYLSVEEQDYPARLSIARRGSEVLLAWFSLAAAVLLASILLSYRAARQQVEQVRQRENFVASVSHEFRTPLGGLALMLEALLSGRVTTPDKQRSYLLQMQRETERLVRLSENVLAMGRLQRGQGLQRNACRAEDLVTPVAERLMSQAHQRRIDLRQRLEANLPALWCDGELARMALSNLLDNALKYSPEGGTVTIAAARDGRNICFSVEDAGPGIAPEEHQRIFGWFYRAGDELTREKPGTGLGLALTREVAVRHHGGVEVHSVPGSGARFELRLPLDGEDP